MNIQQQTLFLFGIPFQSRCYFYAPEIEDHIQYNFRNMYWAYDKHVKSDNLLFVQNAKTTGKH